MILSPSFFVFRKLGQSNGKGQQRQEPLGLGLQGGGGQAEAQPRHRQSPDGKQQPLQPQRRQAAPNVDAARPGHRAGGQRPPGRTRRPPPPRPPSPPPLWLPQGPTGTACRGGVSSRSPSSRDAGSAPAVLVRRPGCGPGPAEQGEGHRQGDLDQRAGSPFLLCPWGALVLPGSSVLPVCPSVHLLAVLPNRLPRRERDSGQPVADRRPT